MCQVQGKSQMRKILSFLSDAQSTGGDRQVGTGLRPGSAAIELALAEETKEEEGRRGVPN